MFTGYTETPRRIEARKVRIMAGTYGRRTASQGKPKASRARADRNKAIRAQLEKWSEKDLRALLKAIESVSKAEKS